MDQEKRFKPKGHISFRLPPERHEELLEVAEHLGIDLTSLLNQIIVEVLPSYLDRARELTEERLKARAALDEVVLTAEHPRVRDLIRVGKPLSEHERLLPVLELALRHRQPGDPPLERTVFTALNRLQEEDRLMTIRNAIEEKATSAARAGGQPEGKAPTQQGRRGGHPEDTTH
jgi:hypothetical protein